jgi:hypothetical protein
LYTCLLGTPEYTAELLQAVDKVNGSLGRVAEWWREREKAAKK